MATRLTQAERRERTRRALLVAAREVFGKRGFGAASLDEISEAAGVTRGALYYNFPGGKEDLFVTLLEERVKERAAAISERLAGNGTDPVETAREAADEWFQTIGPDREWRLLAFEFALHAARDQRFAERYLACEQTIVDAIEEAITSSMAAAGVDLPIRASDLATGISALATGITLDALVAEDRVPDQLFGSLVALLVRGLIATTVDKATN